MSTSEPSKRHLDTICAHVDHPEHDPYLAHTMPLYQTSTFRFATVEAGAKFFTHEEGAASHCYSRLGNPTVEALERGMAELEAHGSDLDCEALMFGSGMAAISAGIMALGKGGSVVAQDALYGATDGVLRKQAPSYGVQTHFVHGQSIEEYERHLKEGESSDHPVRLVYLESVSNPTMRLSDIRSISELAHRYGAKVMVDNTFGTPYHIQPLLLGADIVAYSTTKYQGGHGTIVGGALVARRGTLHNGPAYELRKAFGGIAGPFDAWLTLEGLKTFSLRMQRHSSNAATLATWLEGHPAVERVWYPGLASHPDHALAKSTMRNGFGGMISFELKGGLKAGARMMDQVRLCTLAVSLGAVDTLVQHPASMTHANVPAEIRLQTGITDGMVRLSVGIEDPEDLKADLDQAMRA